MRYAGFWRRLAAVLIDGAVFAPLVAVAVVPASRSWMLVSLPAFALLGTLYSIYFHGRWGQTLGKVCMRIRVVQADGSRLSWRHAFLRSSVDFVLSVFVCMSWMTALLSTSEADFAYLEWSTRMEALDEALPAWGLWARVLENVWLLGETAVLVFSEKSRAIHDFIAGTVVLVLPPRKSRSWPEGLG